MSRQVPGYPQFKAEEDCDALAKAMKGWGCDKKALIKIIANRPSAYLSGLKAIYKGMYGKDLIDELKSETSGDFEDAIVAKFSDQIEFACINLRKAMKGAGTDEDALIEVIASLNNSQLKQVIVKYKEMYGKELEATVKGEVHGDFEKILVSLLQCNRSENKKPVKADCEKKAKELYDAGEGKWGTDESVFNKIFATASKEEITLISQCYHKLTGKTILQAIDNEFSGNLKKIYRTIVYALISPPEYFATRIYDATKGLGTRDYALIRVIVGRDDIDMPQIKQLYKQLYGKDVIDVIKSECSGAYKDFLVELADH